MTDTFPSSGAFTDAAAAEERYVCLDRIGSGGMGLVWRARDTRLDRQVALKTVPQRDEELEQRLDREVKIATRLRGEGVVRILDRGCFPDGRPFVVMELLQTPALTGTDDLHVLAQAARAVGDAHRQGIVHRDLKPSNLALRDGRCVVLDWGLAKPIEDSGWQERVLGAPLTASGVSVGTIGYMAPEQIAGGPARPQSDVWALGAMAYQVLTGRAPFDEGSHQLLAQVSRGALELPEGPAAEVVRRALSLDPGERYADGHAFAQALDALDAPRARSGLASIGPGAVGIALGALVLGLVGGSLLDTRPPGASAPTSDPALHVDFGRALASQGRLLEAREQGQLAEALVSTPESRGLLALPQVPAPETREHACEQLLLQPDARILCITEHATTVLRDGETLARFDSSTEEAWLVGERLLSRQGWQLSLTDRQGRVETLDGSWRGALVVTTGADGWASASGRNLESRDAAGARLAHATAPASIEAVLRVGDQVVASHEGHLVRLELDRLIPIDTLGEPVVSAAVAGGRAVFVGLRGAVIELDATDLTVRDRYRVRHVDQVLAAAIGADRLAVSTSQGVFLSRGGEIEAQLTSAPAEQLAFPSPDLLVAATARTTQTFDLTSVRHLVMPTRASTSALRTGPDPAVAAGGRVFLLDPMTMGWGTTPIDAEDGIVRSIVIPGFRVDNSTGYRRRGRTFEPLGTFPVMALLDDGRAIGVRRWGPGFGVFSADSELLVQDTPPLRIVVTDHDGAHALAVSDAGTLFRLGGDGSITALGVDGLDEPLAAGPLGRVVARGPTIELLEGWTATCSEGDAVRSVTLDRRFVAVGTHAGLVCVYGADGALLQRFQAHPERVSAMMIWGDWLFTGSWAPGVRRWELPVEGDQSRSTTSSSG